MKLSIETKLEIVSKADKFRHNKVYYNSRTKGLYQYHEGAGLQSLASGHWYDLIHNSCPGGTFYLVKITQKPKTL